MSVQANWKEEAHSGYVNKFLHKMHVKYEDLKTAISYFVLGAYMFCFDLKSGYHHVNLPLTVLLPLILFFLLPL